jgi:hypothetical protein
MGEGSAAKTVMIINGQLPLGLIANTTAVLGISLGKLFTDIIGKDILDADGEIHPGITAKAIPILASTRDEIKTIRDRLYRGKDPEIVTVDFSETAQRCLDYDNYINRMANLPCAEIYYLGICLYGPAKKINRLTGNLRLLR